MIKEQSTLDRLLGKRLSTELVNKLLTSDRVSFKEKITNTFAKSNSTNDDNNVDINGNINNGKLSDADIDKIIDDFIKNVKENEALIKQLEDMEDDLLKDMKIVPTSTTVADAAILLGSTDGTITFDVFKTAEMITDPLVMSIHTTGLNPITGAMLGLPFVNGPFLKCFEVTRAIADKWELSGKPISTISTFTDNTSPAEQYAGMSGSIMEQFGEKIKMMMIEMIMNLLFNEMWPRIFSIFLTQLETLICKPIDTPILLFMLKSPSEDNYYKYGPMHKMFSIFKYQILCKIPLGAMVFAGLEYKPNTQIKVGFIYIESTAFGKAMKNAPGTESDLGGSKFKIVSIRDVCKMITPTFDDCVALRKAKDNDPEIKISADKETEAFNKDNSTEKQKIVVKKLYPDNENGTWKDTTLSLCSENITPLFGDKLQGPGTPLNCIEAAKVILDTVYDTSLKNPNIKTSTASALDSILNNSIASMDKANGGK